LEAEVREPRAQIHLCDATSELLGLSCHELDAGEKVDQCGVATFLSLALKSKVELFIWGLSTLIAGRERGEAWMLTGLRPLLRVFLRV
jgi:hypothetical protein